MVTKLRNEITKFEHKPHESLFEAWERYKFSIDRCPNHNMLLVTQIDTFYNGLTLSHRDTINAAAGGTFMQKTPEECYELIENITAHHNHWDTSAIRNETSRNISSTSTIESSKTCGGPHSFTECPAIGGYTQETAYATTGSLPSNTVPNPRADLKAITTRSGVTLTEPLVSHPPSKEVDREPKTITDQVLTGSTNNVPPLVVQSSPTSTSFSTISSSKMLEVTKDTVHPSTKNIQPPMAQAQVPIKPVVAPNPKPTIPYLSRANKQKLHEKDDIIALKFLDIFRNLHFELSFTDALFHMPKFALMFKSLLNNKEKLFDLAMTPLSFLELTSTKMIIKLADRSTTRPAGVAEDVFVKVGKFHFPIDFVVVDYVVNSRVPLILERPFLRTGRALIDVYGEELTLCVDHEAITFKVGFSDNSQSGSSIPTSDLIISFSSPSFTPFEGSDFILEEIKTFLQTPDELSNLDDDYYDTEGDILYIEKLLNEDPSPNLPLVKTKYLKQVNATMTKPSIEEPSELELKELPSHLEYAFLEGTDKLPVIISKELKDEEKSALLKVLKSHKRAIAWKISNIKGVHPRFCIHKILMKDDLKPAAQHQRRVNPKIHKVIKKKVIKRLDA
nr:hypothetical protein [Tanacetum cinerariifolium]